VSWLKLHRLTGNEHIEEVKKKKGMREEEDEGMREKKKTKE
jgi:hypothetical protein